jgi:hypothetical protein
MTPSRLRVLTAMYASCVSGLPAALLEVAASVGLSYTRVYQHAQRLAADGYVEFDGSAKSRAYRVVAVPIFAGDPARIVGFTRGLGARGTPCTRLRCRLDTWCR